MGLFEYLNILLNSTTSLFIPGQCSNWLTDEYEKMSATPYYILSLKSFFFFSCRVLLIRLIILKTHNYMDYAMDQNQAPMFQWQTNIPIPHNVIG